MSVLHYLEEKDFFVLTMNENVDVYDLSFSQHYADRCYLLNTKENMNHLIPIFHYFLIPHRSNTSNRENARCTVLHTMRELLLTNVE